jgi:signal transduction histidine kinase
MNQPKNHILIVDDNPINLDLLSQYLETADFDISVAENGSRALEQVHYILPDLILLDVMMPDLDGFETCSRLKENPNTKDIPVIFMTALDEITDKVKGFEVGAVDYLTKPIQYAEVVARVNTHLTIRNLQRSLKEQNEDLRAFAHMVAHDLNNPLTHLSLTTQLFRHDPTLSPAAHKKANDILQTVDRMHKITEELLLFAKIRESMTSLETVDMAAIVAESQEQITDMITQHQATITSPSSWPVVIGYAPWLVHVWVNYISNAIKYGGTPPLIKLGAAPDGEGYIRFWIQDNGAGLTPAEQIQLFKPFTRLNQGQAKGHGLGLSIVRRIIRKTGGTVGVESQVGQGSTFYFTLQEAQV